MSIYAINKKANKTIIAPLIFLKFVNTESLKQLFSLMRATFNFSPICVTADYNTFLQKGLKNCELFTKDFL